MLSQLWWHFLKLFNVESFTLVHSSEMEAHSEKGLLL